jgi:hypothetical protein
VKSLNGKKGLFTDFWKNWKNLISSYLTFISRKQVLPH